MFTPITLAATSWSRTPMKARPVRERKRLPAKSVVAAAAATAGQQKLKAVFRLTPKSVGGGSTIAVPPVTAVQWVIAHSTISCTARVAIAR